MTTYDQKPCEFKYKIDSCSKVVDGDTVDVLIDLGFDVLIRQRVRLLGIDTEQSYALANEYIEPQIDKNVNGITVDDFRTRVDFVFEFTWFLVISSHYSIYLSEVSFL